MLVFTEVCNGVQVSPSWWDHLWGRDFYEN